MCARLHQWYCYSVSHSRFTGLAHNHLVKAPESQLPYIAVFLEVGRFLAGRFHHLETLSGDAFWSLSCPPKQVSCSFTAGARRRTFAQSAAQRFVASISQESVPSPSEHALRHHRLRRFAARCARLTPENMLGRRMLQGRGSGGPKESKWKLNAARAFNTFFGKRTGSPLPAAPPGAPLSEADRAASSSDEELPPPSRRRRRRPRWQLQLRIAARTRAVATDHS